jgi:hypothetical protein
MGEKGNAYTTLVGNLPERNQLEFISIDGRITLKWIIKKQAGMAPTGVI